MLIQINNLTIRFKTNNDYFTAVDNVSFNVDKGETLGIVGESGSGKTITCLTILKLLPDKQNINITGEILFNKDNNPINLLTLTDKTIRKFRGKEIAMIFQEPMTSLNPVFTCGNQLIETIREHKKVSKKEAKAEALKLLEEVKLPLPEKIFNSYPFELSGGQRQRIMIAMALSCHPSLLIADEPTTALDVTVQKEILLLLKEIQQKYKLGIIFISHDLGVISGIADRIAVMYKGVIVEEGFCKNVFNNPKHPYTKGLLLCRPNVNQKLKYLPTINDFMSINAEKKIVDKDVDIDALMEKLKTQNYEADDVKYKAEKQPLIVIKGLKKYYPIRGKGFFGNKTIFKAVDEVSFEIYKGESLGLVGESGCGKTTLSRTIIKLISSTAGEIFYKNINLSSLSLNELRKLRKDIQIVFQDPYSSLNPYITVGSAISEVLKVHKIEKTAKAQRNKAEELLNKVGLEPAAFNRYPHEFSGGQRQRICIARVLALEPEFIICDESVSALDVSIQAQILNLLNKLKQEHNFTYLFISHDLSVVKNFSDRIIVMNKGKIEEIGDAEEVFLNPQSEYTKNLINSRKTIENLMI